MNTSRVGFVVVGALLIFSLTTQAQVPVISSFSQNGVLVCTNLQPGTVAGVEWASSLSGPWTNWPGMEAVAVESNKTITVSVPMFYRVRGVAWTNPAPAGMALIPAGSFIMGDALDGDSTALPLHEVYVSAFAMDQFEVTLALWDEVRNWAITNGYNFTGGLGKATNHPIYNVSWYDAVKWCNARSEKAGLTPAYYTSGLMTTVYRSGTLDLTNGCVNWNAGYRLPTEAEWEKAARGGAAGHRFSWTDAETITHSQANYKSSATYAYDVSPTRGYHPTYDTSEMPYTSPVGSFLPNGYGLYDMTGNVLERCWDWADSYASGSQTDPHGPEIGSRRECRGGGWADTALDSRVGDRSDDGPGAQLWHLGFRTVLPVSQ